MVPVTEMGPLFVMLIPPPLFVEDAPVTVKRVESASVKEAPPLPLLLIFTMDTSFELFEMVVPLSALAVKSPPVAVITPVTLMTEPPVKVILPEDPAVTLPVTLREPPPPVFFWTWRFTLPPDSRLAPLLISSKPP